MSGYIYILIEREFIKTEENVYKIGKTKQEYMKRFKQYPKDSVLIEQIYCEHCDEIERELIKLFKVKYTQRRDIGIEYFEGDVKDMVHTIFTVWNSYGAPVMDVEEISSVSDWMSILQERMIGEIITTYKEMWQQYILWSNADITLAKFICDVKKCGGVIYENRKVRIVKV